MKSNLRCRRLFLALIFPILITTSVAQSPPPYTISGEVRDEFGQLALGVRVCAFPDASEPKRGIICSQRSDERGKFIIRLAKGGRYGLYYDRSDGYMSQNVLFYRQTPSKIQIVNLNEDTPNVVVTVPLNPKNGAVIGKAIDTKTNLPVENIQITLCKVERPEICMTTSSKTTTGKFRVFGSLSPFTMKISADGYEDWLGATGRGEPIDIASGDSLEVEVLMKRRKDTADLALQEAEKKVGVHLPAPIQIAPEPEAKLDRFPRTTRLEWKPVEGAVSYTVEVDSCPRIDSSKEDCVSPQPHLVRGNPDPSGLLDTSYEFNFIGANPGRWRVWAVDKEGRAGFKSPWRKFTYLH